MNGLTRWLERFFLCLAFALVIGALAVRAPLPAIPIPDGDTWGYLRPALCWLSGLGFRQTYGRAWLYPALLTGILKITGGFAGIFYVQQLLGLASILIFCLTWTSWLKQLPVKGLVWRSVRFSIGAVVVSLYALSPQQAVLQSSIRPEGILAFFEVAYLYCLVSFFRVRWRLHRTAPTILLGGAVLGLSYVILLLKPSWGFSLGFTLVVLIAGAFGKTDQWLRFGPLLSGGCACLFLITLPKILDFQKDGQEGSFLPMTLVSIHAPQILQTASARPLSTIDQGKLDQAFYTKLAEAYRKARENPMPFPVLGFDADFIFYGSGFFSSIKQQEGWTDSQLTAACYSSYFQAWRYEPALMLYKIANQTDLFLFPRFEDFYSTGKSFHLDQELAASRSYLLNEKFSPEVGRIYQSYLRMLESPPVTRSHSLRLPFLTWVAQGIAAVSLLLQVAFFLAMIAIWWLPHRPSFLLAGLTASAVLASTYGNVFTLVSVHTLEITRYRLGYAPMLLLGLGMIISFLLPLVFNTVASWRNGLGRSSRTAAQENPIGRPHI
ncbi:MAG: hypothetical protein JOZ31_06665 [Verrucomicrobia bacterium]|nr:hypothetical protein [Verrucomicrobiota bacterium]MBV8482060.1 hypothetical protein [Verrucomicrobiota bacterium]